MSARILRYFKPRDGLPDPNGSLSASLPTQAIAAVNREVERTIDAAKGNRSMHGISSPPCGRSAEYLPPPVTIDPTLLIKSEQIFESFLGKRPMKHQGHQVESQLQRICR